MQNKLEGDFTNVNEHQRSNHWCPGEDSENLLIPLVEKDTPHALNRKFPHSIPQNELQAFLASVIALRRVDGNATYINYDPLPGIIEEAERIRRITP